MSNNLFTDKDYWKGIILYGLNAATYKIALGKTLLTYPKNDSSIIYWDDLSREYLNLYIERLSNDICPQQGNPSRLTFMERTVRALNNGSISYDNAIIEVSKDAFNDVVPRFQTIGTDKNIVKNKFYEIDFGKKLVLKDSILELKENNKNELLDEINARWSLLEGAFSIGQSNYELSNDIRDIYLKDGYKRKNITTNIPFLNGYQNNTCFYCSEPMENHDIHVDHVLPRQVICNDEIWNLVLAHSTCNLSKEDRLVGKHYIEKLIYRNENIMGSNHPWKKRIVEQLGNTTAKRKSKLEWHYNNVHKVLGNNWWGGIESYNPETDNFYRSFITQLNKR